MATSPQRAYRAASPNCGAPVDFASAASASAVCSFCRSTLVRDGDALRRIGVSAELFDDHSPLQLGASGQRQGVAFTLVGRLQYGYAGGTWNEWHALFDTGPDSTRSAWLSEDNGAYVLAFDGTLPAELTGPAQAVAGLRAGQSVQAGGRAWDVASVVTARVIAAEGELPVPPRLQGDFTVVDLRNSAGDVATLDGSDPARTGWSVGRATTLTELAMRGLKGGGEKTLSARGIECPNCGAALAIQLASTQTITCHQCRSVVDVSNGVGGDLAHYQQDNAGATGDQGHQPQLALGNTGALALGGEPLPWQVVGYQERCDIPQRRGEDDDDETTFWREYLLYNRAASFAFLVDSNEGWSWVRPITGAPTVRGMVAQWQGVNYRQRWDHAAKVTWVQGEFYWRVQRDAQARVTDYDGGGADAARRLSRERSSDEVVWSAGATLDAAAVADAFAIAPAARAALQRDVAPLSSAKGLGIGKALMVIVVVLVLIVLLTRCSLLFDGCSDERNTFGPASAEYRQCANRRGSGTSSSIGSGGSYGGWSSGGGGHK